MNTAILILSLIGTVCAFIMAKINEDSKNEIYSYLFWVSLIILIISVCAKVDQLEKIELQRPMSGSIANGAVQWGGTRGEKCLINVSPETVSVRTASHGNHGAEHTVSVFMLKTNERVCGVHGEEVYITNLSGALLGWGKPRDVL